MRSLILVFLSVLTLSACDMMPARGNHEESHKTIRDQNNGPSLKGEASLRKRVLILPFLDANVARNPEFREKARQAFIMELNRSGELLAVDSSELKIDPKKSMGADEYKMKELAAASKELGVSAILEGKIIDLRVKRNADAVGMIRKLKTAFEAEVRVRMASANGGKEIFNVVKTVTVEQADVRVAERVQADKFIRDNPELMMVIVKDAFLDFTPQIIATLGKVSWEGHIAAINGDRIYLNVGRISGLQVGDLLKVSEEGEDIFDPESGGHIGRAPGRIKGTLEVVSYFGTDGAISVIHSGAGFKENDRVELYQ